MKTFTLKHFLQAFFIPAAGVTLAWYGYISIKIAPGWTQLEWIAAGLTATALLELIVFRVTHLVSLLGLALILLVFVAGIPARYFVDPFPVSVHGVVDHGGFVLALIVATVATFPWRLKCAGYTGTPLGETGLRNHPTDSIDETLKNAEEAAAAAVGNPTMSLSAALFKQNEDQRRLESAERARRERDRADDGF